MKFRPFFLFFLMVSVLFMPVLRAAEVTAAETAETYQGSPGKKLQRGFLNALFSPIEITNEIGRDKDKESFIPTWATGLFRGTIFMACRILAGAYDVVTAPFPVPANYGPIVEPEYVWDRLKENG